MPTRDDIKPPVIAVIARISGFEETRVHEEQLLDDDLGLSAMMRGALAPGFTDIARRHHAHAAVAASACKKLERVKEAIDLVLKKAGGT